MTEDPESARLAAAETSLPDIASRYRDVVQDAGGHDAPQRLWRRAVQDVQGGHFDDRPLYWARLWMLRRLRRGGPAPAAAERHSRGLPLCWPNNEPALLLTGFDPYRLDRCLGQSNPSGLAVLALHGVRIAGVRVVGAILPVRFADFDAGLVEAALAPAFRHRPVLCVTASMGRDGFDLERFPGRRRSAATPDNDQATSGALPRQPLPPLGLDGPEFVEFTLPAAAMAAVPGRWPVRDNRRVSTLGGGSMAAESLAQLAGHIAVAGSGGGYLSNEVAYRSRLLQARLGLDFPLGHVHVPAVTGYEPGAERDIVDQLRRLLAAAIEASA